MISHQLTGLYALLRINILTTYFPNLNPPYDVYYEQILEQVQLAELRRECFMFNEIIPRLQPARRQSGGVSGCRRGEDVAHPVGSCTAKLLPGIVTVEPLPKRQLIRDLVTDIVPDKEKAAVTRTEVE